MQIGWPGLGICCTILILWSIFLSVFCLSACKLMICPSLVARFPEEACQRWTHSAVPRPSTPHTCQLWASKFQKVMQFLVKFFYIHILWLKRPTPLPPSIPEIPKIWEDLFTQISLWTQRWSVETSAKVSSPLIYILRPSDCLQTRCTRDFSSACSLNHTFSV